MQDEGVEEREQRPWRQNRLISTALSSRDPGGVAVGGRSRGSVRPST